MIPLLSETDWMHLKEILGGLGMGLFVLAFMGWIYLMSRL